MGGLYSEDIHHRLEVWPLASLDVLVTLPFSVSDVGRRTDRQTPWALEVGVQGGNTLG